MDFDSTDTIRRMAEADVPTAPLAAPSRGIWDKVRDYQNTDVRRSLREAGGGAEAFVSLGLGIGAQALGVIGAGIDTANKYATGRGDEVDFEKSMGDISQFLTYHPRLEEGQDLLDSIGRSGFMQSLNALGGVAHTLPPLRTAPSPKSFRPDPITAHAAEQALGGKTPMELLRSADYAAIGEAVDPLDPLSIAVRNSLGLKDALPFRMDAEIGAANDTAFGSRLPVTPRETVDAAMAHNLTESAERLRPPEAMPEPLTPEPSSALGETPSSALGETPKPRAGQEIVDRAMAERVKLEEGGKPIDEHLQASKLAPEVQNLLIGLHESGKDGARAARLIDDFVRSVEANPKRPMQDIAADVVEASRRNAEVTPKPGGDPMAASNRVQGLDPSREMPNFEGEAVKVGDEMERVQRVAREGTADELGAIDADLLRVAAECALTVGAP